MSAQIADVVRGPVARIGSLGGSRLQHLCLLLLILFVLVSVFAPRLAPQDPTFGDLGASLQGPSAEHWLGTDQGGQPHCSSRFSRWRSSARG